MAFERTMPPHGCQEPLTLDGWLEFNRYKWKLTPQRVQFPPSGGPPLVKAVLYLNRRGRIVLPRLNPYLPVAFVATPTEKLHRLQSQWLAVARLLAVDMRRRGARGPLPLSPEVADARPWAWAGFRIGLVYTLHIDLPLKAEEADTAVWAKVRKAQRNGYRTERSTDMAHVLAAMRGTEERKNLHMGLTVQDLELARELLGDECLRAYVSYAPDGAPAASVVCLLVPGGRATFWVGGSASEHLTSGATQLMIDCALRDLSAAGVRCADLMGANLPTVAPAKAQWGARLVPYPVVEAFGLRGLARWGLGWLRSTRRRKGTGSYGGNNCR